MRELIDILVVGTALASVWYWVGIYLKLPLIGHERWWIKVILVQGIIIAWALKILKLLG